MAGFNLDKNGNLIVTKIKEYNSATSINFKQDGACEATKFSETGPTDSLVGWWKLDGDAKDCSGNKHHGITSETTVTSGILNQALSFNGTSSYINIPPSTDLDLTTDGCISVWVKTDLLYPSDTTTYVFREIVNKALNGSGSATSYLIDWYGTNTTRSLRAGQYNASGTFGGIVISDFTFPVGWNHLVLTWNTSTIILYLNGQVIGTSTPVIGPNPTVGCPVRISGGFGNDAASTYKWSGEIDDVRIYNRLLLSKEVAQLYALGAGPERMLFTSDGKVMVSGRFREVI